MIFTSGGAFLLITDYSDFAKSLTSLRIYCLGRVSQKFEDYFNLYANLKDRYQLLQWKVTPFETETEKDWKDPIAEE